jgi:hypothetical protein
VQIFEQNNCIFLQTELFLGVQDNKSPKKQLEIKEKYAKNAFLFAYFAKIM